ncbi:MAG: DUF167 domain-containing protein [Thermomicrobiales bacterium]
MKLEADLPSFITQRGDGAVLAIHVSPRSSRSGIGPVEPGVVHVKVLAAAVDGAANAALIRLFAESANVPKSTIAIVAGQTARRKRVLFRGLAASELLYRLGLDREPV